MRIISFIISLWILAASAFAAQSEKMDTGKVYAQLMSSHDSVAPGSDFYVALRTELDDHWHTYWLNPGDSGEPVQIDWQLPDGVTAGDIIWPLPKPIATGPLVNYGFEGAPVFPVKFALSNDVSPGTRLQINADVYYLVCYDVCIPEDTMLSLDIIVGDTGIDVVSSTFIEPALADAPKLGDIQGSAIKDGDNIVYRFSDLPTHVAADSLYFFPDAQGIIDHAAPQEALTGKSGFEIRVPSGYLWDNGTPDNLNGVLAFSEDGQTFGQQVAVSTEPIDIGLVSSPTASSTNIASADGPASGSTRISLWGAILGAFIGGLILNLMPCVFPVISLKALSIAKMAHGERSAIQREAWIYTAGVIATFLCLTLILILFKESWGFQLQSPPVVGALALLLFVVGLNLLGVFEIGGRLQGVGGDLTQKEGGQGSFFTGALAVIVATPCTAPFMAGAIGFAVTASVPVTLAVFLALAIGFAFPFILITYVPGLLKALPKPGAWMERFKEFLAFPMFAAVIWLVWVLTLQTGDLGLLRILGAMLAVGFAIWLFKRNLFISKGLAAFLILGAVATTFMLHPKAVEYAGKESWSTEKVAQLRADGQPVFIDFTAAWCVTCQANKKAVLDTKYVQDMFAQSNTAFLVADWTSKDDIIKAELARHGRAGVPLYLLYPAGDTDTQPLILPQILTADIVEDALKDLSGN